MLFKTFCNQERNCNWFQKRFSEYLDGVLSEKERFDVHEHLKSCALCIDELDQLCKTLSLLADFREECIPAGIQNYRLPRFTFLQIFPTIQQPQKDPVTIGLLAPYATALLLFLAVLSSLDLWERREFHEQYNASNYIEVVAKI